MRLCICSKWLWKMKKRRRWNCGNCENCENLGKNPRCAVPCVKLSTVSHQLLLLMLSTEYFNSKMQSTVNTCSPSCHTHTLPLLPPLLISMPHKMIIKQQFAARKKYETFQQLVCCCVCVKGVWILCVSACVCNCLWLCVKTFYINFAGRFRHTINTFCAFQFVFTAGETRDEGGK